MILAVMTGRPQLGAGADSTPPLCRGYTAGYEIRQYPRRNRLFFFHMQGAAGLVDARAHSLGADQPPGDRRGARPAAVHRPDRGFRRQRPADGHGRHRVLLSQPGALPLREPVDTAGARHVRRGSARRPRARNPGGRALRSEQGAQRRVRRAPGVVLQEGRTESRPPTTGCIRPASTAVGTARRPSRS